MAGPATEAPARAVSAELLSDLAAFARNTPGVDRWVLRYAESRLALLGESRTEADEQPRRVIEKKS